MPALDFTAITGALDATTIVAGIAAIGLFKAGPSVARWGYAKILSMIGR